VSNHRAHIVLIEDEPVTRRALASYLEGFGYRVTACDRAEPAEAVLAGDAADLLIVDINLSGKDGLEITREQRARSEIGIILLTGRTDDVDRIVGLELGADDYVCKPFNRRELAARVKNLLRRTSAQRHLSRRVLRFGGFSFDLVARQIADGTGAAIPLTPAEYEVMRALVAHPGEVLGRDRLAAAMPRRGGAGGDGRSVDVIVRRLRAKLGDDPRTPRILATAHGEGYAFIAPLE
jgi:two-component system torCAD operon response regulator TorR